MSEPDPSKPRRMTRRQVKFAAGVSLLGGVLADVLICPPGSARRDTIGSGLVLVIVGGAIMVAINLWFSRKRRPR